MCQGVLVIWMYNYGISLLTGVATPSPDPATSGITAPDDPDELQAIKTVFFHQNKLKNLVISSTKLKLS